MTTCVTCAQPDRRRTLHCEVCGVALDSGTFPRKLPWSGESFTDYEFKGELGHGGMGVVYLAEQLDLKRLVAIKLLLPKWSEMPNMVQGFLGEAEAGGRVTHPNIATVYHLGKYKEGKRSGLFIVMEYLDGPDLSHLLAWQGRLEWPRALRIIRQVCEATAEAHRRDVVHRDLKPSNIMLARLWGQDEIVKVLDYGLAEILGVEEPGSLDELTKNVMGTYEYMAPEQGEGAKPDPRMDLYAIGVTLFEMLTGKLPVTAETREEIVRKKGRVPAQSMRDARPDLDFPPQLVRIVERTLHRDPEERYQTAEELLYDVDSVASDYSVDIGMTTHKRVGASEIASDASVGRLIEQAFNAGLSGTILMLALEEAQDDRVQLLQAVKYLRSLLAHPAVVEVCDRVLELDPSCYQALESKALALARLGPENIGSARSLLSEAHQIADREGEAPALMGRLYKETWVRSWNLEPTVFSPEEIDRNRERARAKIGDLFQAIEAYIFAYDQTGGRDFYPGLNALTLLALARTLTAADQALWDHKRINAEMARIVVGVARTLDAQIASQNDGEDQYWALASRAELRIAFSELDGEEPGVANHVSSELYAAAGALGPRLFPIDSTLQQLRMMRGLRFRPRLVNLALHVLERKWELAARPDKPATRVVFPTRRHGVADGAERPPRTADLEHVAPAFRTALRQITDNHGEVVVYLGAGSSWDLLMADICADEGVPYVLFLPVPLSKLQDWDSRLETRPIGVSVDRALESRPNVPSGPSGTLFMTEHLGCSLEQATFHGLNRWMYACARTYGLQKVVLVRLGEELLGDQGFPQCDDMAAAVRSSGGDVVIINGELQSETESEKRTTTVDQTAHDGRTEADDPELRTVYADTVPEMILESPAPWVEDIWNLARLEGGREIRKRWERIRDHEYERPFLSNLELRFEPQEMLTPRLQVPPVTLGFQVLGSSRDRLTYDQLHAEAASMGLEAADLDLTLLVLSLQGVNLLRSSLQKQLGPRAFNLQFSVCLSARMLQSPLIYSVFTHFFDPLSAGRVHIEIGSDYSVGDRLRGLAAKHKLRIVIDDSDELDDTARCELHGLASKAKSHIKHTAEVFQHVAKPKSEAPKAVQALARFRIVDRPYVIEGVETRAQLALLEKHWPDEFGDTAVQGWAVTIRDPLTPFFVRDHTEDQPRGYRLAPWVRE